MKGITQPTMSECKSCMNISESFGSFRFPDCNQCHKKKEVDILHFTSNFWGDYAICKTEDGKVFSRLISYIEIVKEEGDTDELQRL